MTLLTFRLVESGGPLRKHVLHDSQEDAKVLSTGVDSEWLLKGPKVAQITSKSLTAHLGSSNLPSSLVESNTACCFCLLRPSDTSINRQISTSRWGDDTFVKRYLQL